MTRCIWLFLLLCVQLRTNKCHPHDSDYGDVIRGPDDTVGSKYFNFVVHKDWPDGVIPYVIKDFKSIESVKRIHAAMDEIQRNSCLKFKRVEENAPGNKVIIKAAAAYKMCRSTVGTKKATEGTSRMELDERTCSTKFAFVLHELMHVIGFYHEHQRKDRDEHVQINLEHIREEHLPDDFEFDYGYIVTPYDYRSIMHYGELHASKNGKQTIVPKKDLQGTKLGGAEKLSPYDIVKLNRAYGCNEHLAACKDKLINCHTLSMIERYCEKKSVDEIKHNCIRTCGMCRLIKTRRQRKPKKGAN